MSEKHLPDFEKYREQNVVNRSYIRFARNKTYKSKKESEKEFPELFKNQFINKSITIIALFLAIAIIVPIVIFLCMEVDHLNDSNSRFEQKHMLKTVKFFNIS